MILYRLSKDILCISTKINSSLNLIWPTCITKGTLFLYLELMNGFANEASVSDNQSSVGIFKRDNLLFMLFLLETKNKTNK